MHAVYFVRPGENEELRYSLRSIDQNTDVERLTIIGDKPTWVIPDDFIQGNPGSEKYPNVMTNLIHAFTEFRDDFVIFNDDFYVLKPVGGLPLFYKHTLSNYTMTIDTKFPEGRLRRTLINRMDMYLRKLLPTPPLSFEVHLPIPVNGADLETAVFEYWDEMNYGVAEPLSWRSLYGNLARGSVEPRQDVIVHGTRDFLASVDFASTVDRTVAPILSALHDRFPEPSKWEL